MRERSQEVQALLDDFDEVHLWGKTRVLNLLGRSGVRPANANDIVRSGFEARGVKTWWEPSSFHMCPEMFRSIYVPYLSELALAAILERACAGLNCGCEFQATLSHEHFELFDMAVTGPGGTVWFDAEHFRTHNEGPDYLDHVEEKLDEVGGGLVLIVNVVADEGCRDRVQRDLRPGVTSVPRLLIRGTGEVDREGYAEIVRAIMDVGEER